MTLIPDSHLLQISAFLLQSDEGDGRNTETPEGQLSEQTVNRVLPAEIHSMAGSVSKPDSPRCCQTED
jgi:hypothetical protein